MKIPNRLRCLAMLLFSAIWSELACAVNPDPRLLSLIPPGAQLVAGMKAPSAPGQPDNFLLLSRDNDVDLETFFALSGVDSSLIVHQMIFVAGGDGTNNVSEHSLLTSGQFDQRRIYESAIKNGAIPSQYNGISVLSLRPLKRDQGTDKDIRWFAVLGSTVAVLGTRSSVQQEIGRQQAGSVADTSLILKLRRLDRKDVTWCVMSPLVLNEETRHSLDAFNPQLAELAHDGDDFQFGIRYGTRVAFEYEFTSPDGNSVREISNPIGGSSKRQERTGSSMLPHPLLTGSNVSTRAVVKVSKVRWEAWLAELSARRRARTAAR